MKIAQSACIVVALFLITCNSPEITSVEVSFTNLTTNSDASLRGLFVVSENVIWASGSGGSVLISKNGGLNWKIIHVAGAETNDFRSIHAWDEKCAMVFGIAGPNFGYSTEDGGENWNVVFQDTTAGLFFNSLKFADDKNGLAVSDPIGGKMYVIRTKNGGKNWKRVEDIPEIVEGEANFAASNTCIEFLPSGKAWIATGGKVTRIFYSDNYGKSWKVAETPMLSGNASGIFSVSFQNKREGVIVGGTYDKPELNKNIAAFTSDGGKTWTPSETMPREYRSCVQAVNNGNKSFLFAIGKTGCDYSEDGGKNWQYISNKGFYTFRPVSGKLTGFAAGSKGHISKLFIKAQL